MVTTGPIYRGFALSDRDLPGRWRQWQRSALVGGTEGGVGPDLIPCECRPAACTNGFRRRIGVVYDGELRWWPCLAPLRTRICRVGTWFARRAAPPWCLHGCPMRRWWALRMNRMRGRQGFVRSSNLHGRRLLLMGRMYEDPSFSPDRCRECCQGWLWLNCGHWHLGGASGGDGCLALLGRAQLPPAT